MTEPNHLAFDAAVHMCPAHRQILRACPEQRRFILPFVLAALELDAVQRRAEWQNGKMLTNSVASAMVDASPLCCKMDPEVLGGLAMNAGVSPCRLCLWRGNQGLFWRLASIVCMVCANNRWIPTPKGTS